MTTYSESLTAMQKFFNAGWNSATTILWGKDDPAAVPDAVSWVRFNIEHNDGSQASIGSPTANRFRHIGIIIIQIFSKEGNYAKNNRVLVNSALALYQGVTAEGIQYYNVRANEIGNDGNGWFQTNVIVEFRYDDIT